MTASIEASEEVWSAILASTLTHIAVFVPLLFLTGVSSIMFKQLSVVVMFSLTMSLFVAVTIVPVLCSRLLKLPPPPAERRGLAGRLYTWQRAVPRRHGRALQPHHPHRAPPPADGPRRRHRLRRRRRRDPADHRLRADAADRRGRSPGHRGTAGRHPRRARRGRGDPPRAARHGIRARGRRRHHAGGGGGGFMGGGGNRVNLNVRLVPKDERKRSSEQIARDLNRQLPGIIPGVIIQTQASGGNQQQNRLFGGGDSRIALEIQGDDLQVSQRVAQSAKAVMDQRAARCATRASAATTAGPSWRFRSIGRRRRCSACRSPASPTRSAPASAARRRRSSASPATNTRSSSGCAKRIAAASRTSATS